MALRRYGVACAASATLHGLLVLTVVWPTAGPAQRPESVMAVFAVAPLDDPRFPGLRPFDHSAEPPARQRLRPLALPDLRIDLKATAARAHLLFPVLTPGLAIDSFFKNPAALALSPPAFTSSGHAPPASGPPLAMDDRAVQSVVDRSWARRGRWQAFQIIAKLMETHAPGGSLPRVLRGYREQNALQPYADLDSRDPRLWTQLSLAADHVSFIGAIRTYAAAHPSTDETTELLLLLDTIVQAEQDALHVLLDTDPADLELTRAASPDAYALFLDVRQEYTDELRRRGLRTPAQIDEYYGNIRLTILQRIIDQSVNGYGVADARFLMGAILWQSGRRSKSLVAWRGLTAASNGSYAASCAALRLALGRSHLNDREIDDVLKNESGRWLSFSYDRLRHFGYRFDRY